MTTDDKANKGRYRVGLRTYKTALAVFLCLFLTHVLGYRGALFASIAAVICMKETHMDTLSVGINRMIGTIIGGTLACIYLILIKIAPFLGIWLSKIIIPIFIIVCIYLCNQFKIKGACVISCAVFLVVVLAYDDGTIIEILSYVGVRVLATLLGIVITMMVNKFIAPLHKDETQNMVV